MKLGRYHLGAFIGKGASGDVYEGTDTSTGVRVAVKCVDCRRFKSIEAVEAVQEEIALLSSLRHRYIVRLLGVEITPSHICFVMEHAGGGTLAQHLRAKEGHQLSEGEALDIFLQIFQAVEFCHRRCVVHRDLKPENILLGACGDVKVADFGMASILTPYDGDVSNLVGTPEFMAPDLLVSTCCDGAKADMWSLGVMLYEALAGHTPFNGPNLAAILRAALRNEYAPLPPGVSAEGRRLVAALLHPDPLRRATLEQALQHPWLARGLERGRVLLSPLPSCDDEAAAEGEVGAHIGKQQRTAQRSVADVQAVGSGAGGDGDGSMSQSSSQAGAGRAGNVGASASGLARPSSHGGMDSGSHRGSMGRLHAEPSLASQHSSLSLSLSLSGMHQDLEPVAEESSTALGLEAVATPGAEAGAAGQQGQRGSRDGKDAAGKRGGSSSCAAAKPAAGLARRRSLQPDADAAPPVGRFPKSLSAKTFSMTASATSAAAPRSCSGSRPPSRGQQ